MPSCWWARFARCWRILSGLRMWGQLYANGPSGFGILCECRDHTQMSSAEFPVGRALEGRGPAEVGDVEIQAKLTTSY